ncbi:MAG: FKBP-type peptidyl-prolyl cis-trans isomerase [Sphingobacteriia bacterium]|nr:FKBP-type peptidyl-prolyl cis-trans isomerase [Paludibacteraceae bacterium]NCA78750.1 FKBP-type peptidyl-prolyl cis-trans isomerase [Sphingobacteriia bacterium]
MKKIAIVLFGAAVAVSLVSCNGTCSQKVENELDSLNYAFGAANGSGIKQYVLAGDSSTASVNALIKGIKEGSKKDDASFKMYVEGLKIGAAMKEQFAHGLAGDTTLTPNEKLVMEALVATIQGDENALMDGQEAYEYFMAAMQRREAEKNLAQYADNKKAGEDFLAQNATKNGVVTTASGLQYEILKAGKGAKPTATDKVRVHYHGTLLDGTVFDSSVERKQPAEFNVNQVIAGWTEALQLMPIGSKWKLYIPQELAYGSANQGNIKPFSMLIFEVELLDIVK